MKTIKIVEGTRTYEIGLGQGCWAKSHEITAQLGDTRMIDGELMYAYSIYRNGLFKEPTVNWVPVDKNKTMSDMIAWARR